MSDTRPGRSDDALAFLSHQHRQFEGIWKQLEAAHGTDADVQRELARQLVAAISQHDAIETQLLYPVLREHAGPRGVQLSDHSLEEHQHVREQLHELDGADPRHDQVFAALSQCVTDVNHHVHEEETQIFPLLREHCDGAQLDELGRRMAKMMATAPTHPHPHMPSSKAGATVVGAVAGVVDKARDALRSKDR